MDTANCLRVISIVDAAKESVAANANVTCADPSICVAAPPNVWAQAPASFNGCTFNATSAKDVILSSYIVSTLEFTWFMQQQKSLFGAVGATADGVYLRTSVPQHTRAALTVPYSAGTGYTLIDSDSAGSPPNFGAIATLEAGELGAGAVFDFVAAARMPPAPLPIHLNCSGHCCVVLYQANATCTPVPVWNMDTFSHPGGAALVKGFFGPDGSQSGTVVQGWRSLNPSHTGADPESGVVFAGAKKDGEYMPSACGPPPPPPKGCTPSDLPPDRSGEMYECMQKDGDFALHWTFDKQAATVDIAGVLGGASWCEGCYVGVGFSSDGGMAGSDAVLGWEGQVPLWFALTTTASPASDSPFTAPARLVEQKDGTTTVRFARTLVGGRVPLHGTAANLLLWATGKVVSGKPQYHSAKSSFGVNLGGGAAGRLPIPKKAKLMLAHGVGMLLGWGALLPLGVVVARFYKPFGKQGIWFKVHRATQLVGTAVVLAAWVLALVSFGPPYGSTPRSEAHFVLGNIVMVCGLLQPLNAALRPAHGATWRKQWEALHKGAGYLSLLLSVPTILLGAMLLDQQAAKYFPGSLVGFLVAYVNVLFLVVVMAIVGIILARQPVANSPKPLAEPLLEAYTTAGPSNEPLS